MKNSEAYLNPRVVQTIRRLDLKAQFIVKGFMHGLHASPLQGFSVEFSEHRKYEQGDDPKDIDWRLYARTDKYYVRKYESETNMTGWLVVDSSASMGVEFEGEITKFDYAISLSAAGSPVSGSTQPVSRIFTSVVFFLKSSAATPAM